MEHKDSFCETVKSVVAADAYRIKGNNFYKQRTFREALVEYNKSICCSPPQSKELGLAYANRSAIYFEVRLFQKCVENIKLARESHYPADKMKLLRDREEKCLKYLKSGFRDLEFNVWDFFKLSYKANKKIPFIIDGLELAENEKYGRMIVTTRDLKAGNIIAIEEPCFKVLDEMALKYRCSFCLKCNEYSLIPCEKCPKVMYCSKACRDKDIHQIDCMVREDGSQPTLPEKMFFAAIRILKSESAALSLMNVREQKTVFDFDLLNPEAADYEEKILKIVNSLPRRSGNQPSSGEPRSLNQHFTEVLNCKSDLIYELPYGESSREAFGGGILAFSSLLNHSCYPNVTHVAVEGKVVLIVTRPIKAGEQIFMSFGPMYSTDDISIRKPVLQHLYGFVCDCIACANNYPLKTGLPGTNQKVVDATVSTGSIEAISQFRKHCDYINRHSTLPPTFEVATFEAHNNLLLHCIARRTLNDWNLGVNLTVTDITRFVKSSK